MPKKVIKKTKTPLLNISLIVLTVFFLLTWYVHLAYDASSKFDIFAVDAASKVVRSNKNKKTNVFREALDETGGITNKGVIGIPMRIRVPSILLDAPVRQVAVKKDGSMDVPKDPMDTGWYRLGPRPGEVGSATIAGHVDWYNGASGVFENLSKVKVGDRILVHDESGEVVSFVVKKLKEYDANADARDVFTSSDGKAHLNLITCTGVWNKRTQQYTKRLVVFADKQE